MRASGSSNQLLNGYISVTSSGQLSATISGIPYANYNLYAYMADSTSGYGEEVTLGGTTYYYGTTNSANYMQVTNTTAGTYPTGNYVVATGLTGGSQTVTVQGANQQYGSFCGFEIVNTAPTSPMTGQRGDAHGRFDDRRDRAVQRQLHGPVDDRRKPAERYRRRQRGEHGL